MRVSRHRGYDITIDAHELPNPRFNITYAANNLDSRVPQTPRMALPQYDGRAKRCRLAWSTLATSALRGAWGVAVGDERVIAQTLGVEKR
jgi:hypothetical protein